MFCTGTRLQAIKVLHTAAWTVFASAIVALPVAAWRGEFHVAVRLIALISLELMVLAANRGRCPLTAVAARHTTNDNQTSTSTCRCGSPGGTRRSSERSSLEDSCSR